MKKFIALTMAVLMMVGLVACGSADSGSSNPGAAYNIGVCQLVQHVALDDASQGFMDALNAALPVDAATPVSIYCVPVLSRYSTCAS